MSEKTVILETNSKSKKKNITWQPIRNGKTFLKYLNLNNKLEEIDRKNLTDDSISLIGQTINPSTIDKVGMNSTGLCFGQIQSGKTTSMEAISALAHDNKFKIIILLTGNVTPLARQNTSRVDQALQGREWLVIKNLPKPAAWNKSENIKEIRSVLNSYTSKNKVIAETFNKTILILSMKNPSKINRVTNLFLEASSWDNSLYNKIPTIIIDDEADHHSLNSKASKNTAEDKEDEELYKVEEGETWETLAEKFEKSVRELREINPDYKEDEELTLGDLINTEYEDIRTHRAIKDLRSVFNFHSFLGYTATPNANLLTNTLNFLSPNFSQILEPGSQYTGLEYFFGEQKSIDRFISSMGSQKKIKELEDSDERPKALENAFMHFVVSVACGYISGHSSGENNRSMFIHPDRLHESHDQYIRWINGLKMKWDGELNADKNSEEYKDLIQYIKKTLEGIRNNSDDKNEVPEFTDEFIDFFKQSLNVINPIRFNSKESSIEAPEWDRKYPHLLVGGQGLDRGFTVEGITVSYLSRAVGTRQQDTLLQRARFFGYHKKNRNFIKIFLTDELSDFFRDTFHSDRELRMSLKRHSENPENNLKDWPRVWISRNIGNYKLTRPGINNSWSIVSRNVPPPPARQAFAAKMRTVDLDTNREIYRILRSKYDNNLKKISSIEPVTNNNPWAKKDEALIVENVTLKSIYDDVISKIKHEARDIRPFFIAEQIISYYLNSGKDDLNCPIIFMDGRNFRSPDKKDLDRIQTAGGRDTKLKNNPNDKSLFPGDRLVHYEYLFGQSNNERANYYPTLQIYNLKIYPKPKQEGKPLENVPYFNFYMPNECWTDIITGIKKSDIPR